MKGPPLWLVCTLMTLGGFAGMAIGVGLMIRFGESVTRSLGHDPQGGTALFAGCILAPIFAAAMIVAGAAAGWWLAHRVAMVRRR